MPSLRSYAINNLTRVATRIAYRKPKTDVADYRPQYAKVDERAKKPLPGGLTIDDVSGPVAGRWVHNANSAGKTILYLHGGAFIMRLPNTHTALAAWMCEDLGASAFLPWYRLAPEHPFPAAPDDCLAAYRMLLDDGRTPDDIVFMGDSAGGNLVLATLHLVARAGLPMPSACVALSPITDFAQISATWRFNTWRDPMYVVQGAVAPQTHYLQGASPVDPIASPYYGDLTAFPPTLVVVGGLEAMLDDAVSFVHKAVDAGVEARVHIWKGMPHVFMINAMLPESDLGRRAVADWLREIGSTRGAAHDGIHYRSSVQIFDRAPITGKVRRQSNDVFLVAG